MKLTKKQLYEIIDSNGELIGGDAIPTSGSDLETQANNTTDYNVKVGTQPFRYDMLGRFGFTLLPFFEGKDAEDINPEEVPILKELAELMYEKFMETLEYYYRNPNKLKSDFRMHSEHDFESQPEENRKIDYDWAKKVIATIHPHLDKEDDKDSMDEGVVIEDKMVDKKSESEMSKKSDDKGIREKRIEKIAGLINKLDKKDIDKLVNLLERK
jgi:hypothetical protein